VPSPKPLEILEAAVLAFLVEHGVIVICAGGGGIPVVELNGGGIAGIEAVIDKDLASSLLARQLGADMLVMLTDVDAVYLDWGTPKARPLDRVQAGDISAAAFASGSMGPKVEAAIAFATETGQPAAIGKLEDAVEIVAGRRGTRINSGG
jgi:carbamate kinase